MTRNDKILLTFCFILGCIVTFFISGCSRPNTVTYNMVTVETIDEQEENTEELSINHNQNYYRNLCW